MCEGFVRPPGQKFVKKILDSTLQFTYSHLMIISLHLTIKLVLKAAWRVDAVAEGGFY